jgi:hypothetical protein
MKILNTITIIVTFLLLSLTNVFSQSLTVDDQIPTGFVSIDHALSQLDMTAIPTGILKEKGTPLVNLSRFDGTNINNYNYSSPLIFGMTYATLLDGAVASNYSLPDISYLPTPLPATEGMTIPMTFLYAQYDYMSENAVNNNLFSIQNNQLHDVSNRPSSPYITENIFVATPWMVGEKIIGDTITFTVPTGGIIGNAHSAISSLSVDFGDGSGPQIVQENSTISVIYTQEGTYNWVSTLTLTDGTILQSHALTEVQFPLPIFAASPPPPTGGGVYSFASRFNIPISGAATVTGLSSCCDTVIRKPLIIVEGFNVSAPNRLSTTFVNNFPLFFGGATAGATSVK